MSTMDETFVNVFRQNINFVNEKNCVTSNVKFT